MSEVFAGIDLGGTNLYAALATEDGGILAECKEPTRSHEGPDAVVARMIGLVGELAARAAVRPAALGIGVPGLVNLTTGTTLFLPNLPTQWRGVPVRERMEAALGWPVHLLNDARAATLGEFAHGRGRGGNSMVFFTLGTGVGGGIVLDGKLRLGPLGAAGEIGHQTVQPDGPLCGCGNRGCLETLASGSAIAAEGVRLFLSGNAPRLHELCEGEVGRVDARTMAEAARAGDRSVAEAISRAAEWLGLGAANLVTALHPERIVLGGGVAELGDLLLDPVRTTIRQRVGMFSADDVAVEVSALGDRAGLIGALTLAVRNGAI